jgi:hypothetical protein
MGSKSFELAYTSYTRNRTELMRKTDALSRDFRFEQCAAQVTITFGASGTFGIALRTLHSCKVNNCDRNSHKCRVSSEPRAPSRMGFFCGPRWSSRLIHTCNMTNARTYVCDEALGTGGDAWENLTFLLYYSVEP